MELLIRIVASMIRGTGLSFYRIIRSMMHKKRERSQSPQILREKLLFLTGRVGDKKGAGWIEGSGS